MKMYYQFLTVALLLSIATIRAATDLDETLDAQASIDEQIKNLSREIERTSASCEMEAPVSDACQQVEDLASERKKLEKKEQEEKAATAAMGGEFPEAEEEDISIDFGSNGEPTEVIETWADLEEPVENGTEQ